MNNLVSEVQRQEINSPIVYLYEIYVADDLVLYFHPGLSEDLTPLKFRDKRRPNIVNVYHPMPIEMTGVEATSDGAQIRPTLTIANVTNVFKDLLEGYTYKDLVGKRVTRRSTLKKYLYSEEGDSIPPQEFPSRTFFIDRVAGESPLSIEFELASPFDLEGVQIPNRVVIGKYCSWVYQGADKGKGGCVWPSNSEVWMPGSTGALVNHLAYFTDKDEPIIDITQVSGPYVPGTTYAKDVYVSEGSNYWYSKQDGNQGNTPGTSDIWWGRARVGHVWVSGQSYSEDFYVSYGGTAWRCRLAHISTADNAPHLGSRLWARGDNCSKTLDGCKKRFQFIPVDPDMVTSRPSVELDSNVPLPFGGFPGTNKFR